MKKTIFLAISIIALLVSSAIPAAAWTASNLNVLSIREDYFYNYDFNTTDSTSYTNTDFPVTMLFWNNAEIDKVKAVYISSRWELIGNNQFARLNDGSGWEWDNDRGVKTYGLHNCHMRLYAPGSTDTMYNVDWGYYILGTTHYDYFEFAGGWSGYSEDAEAEACQTARNGQGWGVVEDWSTFYNYEAYRVEGGSHIWDNNGLVSAVYVP